MRHTTTERPGKHTTVMAVLMAGVFLLAGCSSPPDAGPTTPTVSAPASTVPVPTTEPPPTTPAVYKPATAQGPAQNVPVPVLPDKAKEFSKEGLIAFTEYWYSTLGYVYETGDSDPMMAVSATDCKTCAFINEPIGKLYDQGGWIVGGKMTVYESSTSFQQASDGAYEAILMVQQAKVTAYAAKNRVTNDYPQRRARANIVAAHFHDGQWTTLTAEPLGKE